MPNIFTNRRSLGSAGQIVGSLFVLVTMSLPTFAVSPNSVLLGRQLFEHDWAAGNPTLGGDGLGPLFNAQSCAACHHQGGVGGGGDSKFDAITVGIEMLDVTGPAVSDDLVAGLLRNFHPGFIGTDGGIINTLSLLHHGGTDARRYLRQQLLAQVPAEFSDEGGSSDAAEVRLANATPVLFNGTFGPHQLTLRARLYQRNTTALFGVGLIDRVSGREIEAVARLQKRHPEISGRPATLADGRYGKFGWRGNQATLLDFVDQACAAELGLATRRKSQPADSMNPEYRNSKLDISDEQIIAMRNFIRALPAPTRQLPEDSKRRAIVLRGERAFAKVGCAVCHPAQLGSVTGIYSDLLLHDMGAESIDLSHAEPYIIKAKKPIRKPRIPFASSGSSHPPAPKLKPDEASESTDTTPTISPGNGAPSGSSSGAGYAGSSSSISTASSSSSVSSSSGSSSPGASTPSGGSHSSSGSRFRQQSGHFHFESPATPQEKSKVVNGVVLTFEPTRFNQEWRTPPLWGLRDSAPYMHDGRAESVLEAIALHEGEAAGTRDRFLRMSVADRHAVIAFLNTLVAPPTAPQPGG